MARAADTFMSLRNRNFRLFFVGHSISATGTWMQKVGQAWLVLELSDSGVLLGVVAALQHLPTLLIGVWGGLMSDRLDKRKLIVIVESIAGVLALILALLTLTGQVQLWMVWVLALGLGVTDAFDRPARRSFVLDMVPDRQVANAVTLSAVVANVARVIGPAMAGFLIAEVGIATTFFVNAASYGGVVVGLVLIRVDQLHAELPVPRSPGQVRDGLRYAATTPGIAAPLLLLTVAGIFAFEYNVTLPLLARDAFGAGADTFGLLFSALGLGSVAGGIVFAGVLGASNTVLVVSAGAFGVSTLLVGFAPNLAAAMIALVVVGATSIVFKSQTHAIAQLRSVPQMRGRVAAMLGVATAGTTPIGGPIVGWIGERFGPRPMFGLGAVMTLLATGLVARYLRANGELGTPVGGSTVDMVDAGG